MQCSQRKVKPIECLDGGTVSGRISFLPYLALLALRQRIGARGAAEIPLAMSTAGKRRSGTHVKKKNSFAAATSIACSYTTVQ